MEMKNNLASLARSPNLTPLDFYLQGYAMQKLYQNYLYDLNELGTNELNN